MNTRHEFIICCRKLTNDQLRVLRDCVYGVMEEREVNGADAEHLELTMAERFIARNEGRIAAIRDYRIRTQTDLRSAVNAVDAYLGERGR